jgi:hypothetical protein
MGLNKGFYELAIDIPDNNGIGYVIWQEFLASVIKEIIFSQFKMEQ